ncbi:hypothetical protein G5C60_07540 [Streptomyces sp. HC44]|uniref:Uncharacterized protein n=1 Tax=Streptomyces scabichelini TaxID=2711217 RepID=A0A6G4V0E8_9ACTN|nr:hypothetical protein [Streptomyces scabichelini]NGO07512.1 hypothetical protein [Streptomyces scabichelini]
MTVFFAAVSEEHRRDVLHSVLLAQLVAGRKHGRHTDAEAWYSVYGETLERVGWVVKEHAGLGKYRPRSVPYRMSTVVQDILSPVSDERSRELTAAALKALALLPDADRASVLFEKESHADRAGNFQLIIADENDGSLAVRLGRFHFRAVQDIERLTQTDFQSRTRFWCGTQILHLNEQIYAPLRGEIAAKLGFRVDALIVPVSGLAAMRDQN